MEGRILRETANLGLKGTMIIIRNRLFCQFGDHSMGIRDEQA
jgi:hypothetical protein